MATAAPTARKEVDLPPQMPTADEMAALAPAPVKTMRCYAIHHGLGFNVVNDDSENVYNQSGKIIGKKVHNNGYSMKFINHRCDVPMDPKAKGGEKALIVAALAKREVFFKNEWMTAPEVAKVIDDPMDSFIGEMYRRSVACGKIRSAESHGKKGMSEGMFVKLLRQELIELGYLKKTPTGRAE